MIVHVFEIRILSQKSLTKVIGGHEHQVGQQEVIQQQFCNTGNTSSVTYKAYKVVQVKFPSNLYMWKLF